MNNSPAKVGGVCAILSVLLVSTWVVFPFIASGIGIEFPESSELAEWAQVRTEHRAAFLAVDWLVVFGLVFELAAAVGFFWVLRKAGPLTWFGLAAWVTGLILVMVEHILVISIDQAVMPGYVEATEAVKPVWEAITTTISRIRYVFADVGNTLDWGVGLPIFAFASLRLQAVPKWIGWLGLLVGVVHWQGIVARFVPALDVIPWGISFLPFFLWMIAMGIVFLRLREPVREAVQDFD